MKLHNRPTILSGDICVRIYTTTSKPKPHKSLIEGYAFIADIVTPEHVVDSDGIMHYIYRVRLAKEHEITNELQHKHSQYIVKKSLII